MSDFNQKAMAKLGDRLLNVGSSIRFAGIVALTKTSVLARDAVKAEMRKDFTLRNTWSERSVTITPATKQQRVPFAEVYVRDKYLADQELGTLRRPKNAPAIPFQIRAELGIDPKRVIPQKLRASSILKIQKAIKAGNKPFINKTHSGKKFIFIREGEGRFPIRALYKLDDDESYTIKPRPFFFDTVEKTWQKELEPEYDKAFNQFVLGVKH